MHGLNIQAIYAESSSAKGRVERANLTLQVRLVKKLRLKGISCMDDANALAEEFMADYNESPRHDFDIHRQLDMNDVLDAIFTWLGPRRISKSLTVQYDKMLYLIEDSALSRNAIGKYIEVWDYPDERKETYLNGGVPPYSIYDRLPEVDQSAIVDNKCLGRTLELVKMIQDKRYNTHSQAVPACNSPSRRHKESIEKKPQRALYQGGHT